MQITEPVDAITPTAGTTAAQVTQSVAVIFSEFEISPGERTVVGADYGTEQKQGGYIDKTFER